MEEFNAKSLCILGRQPALGIAELESLYGAEHLRPLDGAALLDIDAGEINFARLGGTIKVARILAYLDTTDWNEIKKYLIENVPKHLSHLPEGKFTLGLSTYGLPVDVNAINQTGLQIKKLIKKTGRPVRIVPNKSAALNSAQVLHNRLTVLGAWELLLFKNHNQTILAQTFFVQDIEAYGARDQARPKRDSRVGMLPPKLAQIIINLAAGAPGSKTDHAYDKKAMARWNILDPFCGTGVLLQEALLMGYSVTGTDLEPRMVSYSKENLQWLVSKYPSIEGRVVLDVGDATNYQWPPFSVVGSEVVLGPPLNSLPRPDELKQIVQNVNTIIKKFLKNLQPQLKPDRKICLAVPAWRQANGKLVTLPLVDQISDLGYNWVDFEHVDPDDLAYFREDQIVVRQLLVLTKKVK